MSTYKVGVDEVTAAARLELIRAEVERDPFFLASAECLRLQVQWAREDAAARSGDGSAAIRPRFQLGDYFTHNHTGERFVCRAITRSDRDGSMKCKTVFEIEWEAGE